MVQSLNISKAVALNAPKYTKIVEPFGDNGMYAAYLAKKKPKEHIVNIENIELYNELIFIQQLTPADKKQLKSFDWVGSQETFDAVVKITATEGVDFYYKKNYLKNFAQKQKDPEAAPLFDWLKFGKDKKGILNELPILNGLFKKVTFINGDSIKAMGEAGDFYILNPKTPEQITAVEGRLGSISGNFIYAKKSKNIEQLSEAIDKYKNDKVSVLTASTIMAGDVQVVTNYDNKFKDLAQIREESGAGK